MKERPRFIDPIFSTDSKAQDCLNRLGVKKLLTEEALLSHVFPLPPVMDENERSYLKRLIRTLPDISFTPKALQIMKQTKFAVDGTFKFRTPSELYDHKDSLFVSAFRNQHDTKFLHESMQVHRSFWLKIGLRQRRDGSITAGDYLPCLQALNLRLIPENRFGDANLVPDTEKVLAPLTSPSAITRGCSNAEWQALSQQKVFRSFTGFDAEPEYRRNTMAAMARSQPLLSLSAITSHDHIAVCWSQTSFAIQKPTRDVLLKVPGNGRPSTDMVLRHLSYMQGMAEELNRYQLRDFLADLDHTYQYLHDHINETTTSFNLENKPVWLNLDSLGPDATMNDFETSWHGIKDLVLSSSCDAGAIKAVRPGLMRYEKLLRALGCKSITYPTVKRPDLQLGPALGRSLREMWKAEQLVDITYSTEGRLIKAHRVVLAAMSEKCARQFKGDFHVEGVITFEDPDDDGYLSYHTLFTMVKFAYEDDIDWKEMEVAENDDVNKKATKLDLLLDLHKGADYWRIPSLASQVEDKILVAGRALINLENVIYVRDRADEANAKRVEQMCASFIEQNRDAVNRAHAENSE
jgi:sacsin